MPHHSEFVTNPGNLPTFVELLQCTGFAAICAGKSVAKVGNLHASSIDRQNRHVPAGRIVPGTAVDNTFQVLFVFAQTSIFVQTAQTPELNYSPF